MNITIERNVTTADTRGNPLPKTLTRRTPSTSHNSAITIQLGNTTSETWFTSICFAYNDIHSEDDIEELIWDNIVSTPRVRNELRRLAEETQRQIEAGEMEEGGFASE